MVLNGKAQTPVASLAAPPKMLQPTPTPQLNTQTVISPDGKMELKLTKKKAQGGVIWTASVGDKEIFNQTLPESAAVSVPFNTFSPDNKYVFLKETSEDVVSYPVLSTAGSPLSADGSIPEIASLFSQKHPDYRITEATGWGGINLIVFNTQKATGEAGPSFWFEVPSHAFIQLSSKFN